MRMLWMMAVITLLLIGNGIPLGSAAPITSDSCDWIGSGSSEISHSRGVQPVYLRCIQGTLQWHYPEGALRVVLRHGSAGNEFRGCFRVANGSSGARLFLASRKKLHLVFKQGDPVDLVRCMTSKGGQMALYVEADPVMDTLKKTVTEFSYQLKKIPKKDLYHDAEGTWNVRTLYRDYSLDVLMQEFQRYNLDILCLQEARWTGKDCRPCSEEELLDQYCTSDFVVQGTVSSLYHNTLLQRTEITVRATKVFRDSEPAAFMKQPSMSGGSPARYATLHRSLNCGTKAGNGEFLFLGRWMLGNPTLNCIPRFAEWKKVRRKAIMKRTHQCQLE